MSPHTLAPASIIYLTSIALVLPLLAYMGKRRLDAGLRIPKIPFYTEAVILQAGLLAWSLWIARTENFSILAKTTPRLSDALVTLLFLALALCAMWISFTRSERSSRDRLSQIVPFTPRERAIWLGVSAVAGVAEEVIYRGVLFRFLLGMSESFWISTLVAATLFAFAHVVQGWKSALFVAVFAVGFHLLVRYTGSLYWAMAAHFLYDVVAGLLLGSVLKRPAQGPLQLDPSAAEHSRI